MSDKNGWISDDYHGFIDQNTGDCITSEVIDGL